MAVRTVADMVVVAKAVITRAVVAAASAGTGGGAEAADLHSWVPWTIATAAGRLTAT